MSVILDALHKARGDKRKKVDDPKSNIARVLETGVSPHPTPKSSPQVVENIPPKGKSWAVILAITFGMICLLILISGAFFLLYDQLRRLEIKNQETTTQLHSITAISAKETANGGTPTISTPAALPTPVPLTELPVQPPAPAGSTSSQEKSTFKLGSIVCDNTGCIASLNDRSVHIGDEIQGYTVTAITATEVTLHDKNGKVLTLSLYE